MPEKETLVIEIDEKGGDRPPPPEETVSSFFSDPKGTLERMRKSFTEKIESFIGESDFFIDPKKTGDKLPPSEETIDGGGDGGGDGDGDEDGGRGGSKRGGLLSSLGGMAGASVGYSMGKSMIGGSFGGIAGGVLGSLGMSKLIGGFALAAGLATTAVLKMVDAFKTAVAALEEQVSLLAELSPEISLAQAEGELNRIISRLGAAGEHGADLADFTRAQDALSLSWEETKREFFTIFTPFVTDILHLLGFLVDLVKNIVKAVSWMAKFATSGPAGILEEALSGSPKSAEMYKDYKGIVEFILNPLAAAVEWFMGSEEEDAANNANAVFTELRDFLQGNVNADAELFPDLSPSPLRGI